MQQSFNHKLADGLPQAAATLAQIFNRRACGCVCPPRASGARILERHTPRKLLSRIDLEPVSIDTPLQNQHNSVSANVVVCFDSTQLTGLALAGCLLLQEAL